MKILFLSYWFPYPPNNGSRIRIFNFIKALSESHDVYLISLLQEDSHPVETEIIEEYCTIISLHPTKQYSPYNIRSYFGFFSKRPRSIVATFDPIVNDSVKKAISKISPDVIVVSTVDVVEYIGNDLDVPSLLIDHNCEFGVIERKSKLTSNLFCKMRYSISWKKFAKWEASVLRKFDVVVMPTEADKRRMIEFAPDIRNIVVIPNAADTEYFDSSNWLPDDCSMIYNGALTYSANLDAVHNYLENIYPLLVGKYPNIKLRVTGRYTNIDLDGLIDCLGIQLTGYISDIRDVLYRSSVCIIPLRLGGGMRLKIPEAMAAGVPVVSTSMGAEGLDCIHEKHLLIADTPEDFADAIMRIFEDNELVEKLRTNARQLIEDSYSWKIVAKKFTDLVESLSVSERDPTNICNTS